jgi:hypothetical protein
MNGVELHDQAGVLSAVVEAWTATDETIAYLAGIPNLERLAITRCHGNWKIVARLILAVLDRIRALRLAHVIWQYPIGFEELGGIQLETADESRDCWDMFSALPPRPVALLEIELEPGVELPPSWRR